MASLLKSLLPAGLGAPAPEKAVKPAEAPRAARPSAAASEPVKAPRGRFGRNAASGPAPIRSARSGEGQPAARTESRSSGAASERSGEFTQLFVSIGRNRRVFARDLIALFTEKLALAEGDIGDVRVFEKYSFVDIVPARAGEAIEKLSGTSLKGRTIAVNYAKKKEEKEET
jgi:hypothetical protein